MRTLLILYTLSAWDGHIKDGKVIGSFNTQKECAENIQTIKNRTVGCIDEDIYMKVYNK